MIDTVLKFTRERSGWRRESSSLLRHSSWQVFGHTTLPLNVFFPLKPAFPPQSLSFNNRIIFIIIIIIMQLNETRAAISVHGLPLYPPSASQSLPFHLTSLLCHPHSILSPSYTHVISYISNIHVDIDELPEQTTNLFMFTYRDVANIIWCWTYEKPRPSCHHLAKSWIG